MTPILSFVRRTGRYVADNVIAFVALLVALSGAAYAANTVGSSDIIDDSILSADIHANTITRQDMAWAKWQQVQMAGAPGQCAAVVGEFCSGNDPARVGATVTWRNEVAGGYQGARFRRNATSEVALQGTVETNIDLLTFQLPIFVLPVGYRPMNTLDFVVACKEPGGNFGSGVVEVFGTGEVFLRGPGCSTLEWVSLTGITFPIG